MQLPTLDHPGWGRLLAVVATGQGPQPIRSSLGLVAVADTSDAHEHDEHDHENDEHDHDQCVASSWSGSYA